MTKAESDRLKVALLGVGVLAVFGFIYIQVTGANKPIVPVKTEAVPVMPAGAQAQLAPPEADLIVLNEDPTAIEFNPFRKVLKPVSAPPTMIGGSPAMTGSGAEASVPSEGEISPLVPKVDIAALDRQYLDSMPLHVDGVIVGEKPVAVVRMGSESYVVGLGDPLGEGVTLIEIRESYVVFRKGKSLRRVRVGDTGLVSLLAPWMRARTSLL